MFSEGIARSALSALGVISRSPTASHFYLAGGTAAALRLGHRLSVDLDLFCPSGFDGADLARELEREGVMVFDQHPARGTLHGVVADTKVRFLSYPYPLLEPTETFAGIEVAALLDIGLMKITAIASRGAKKDFVDLDRIIETIPLDLLFERFADKFPVERLEPYHFMRSLTFFDDAESDPDPSMLGAWSWDETKARLRAQAQRLMLRR